MISGWFHIAFINSGYEIACELHGRILQSGLYHATDAINVCMVGDVSQSIKFDKHVLSHWPKYKVVYSNPSLDAFEWPALMHMREHAFGNCWYVHTKGASNTCVDSVPLLIQANLGPAIAAANDR